MNKQTKNTERTETIVYWVVVIVIAIVTTLVLLFGFGYKNIYKKEFRDCYFKEGRNTAYCLRVN